MSSTKYIEVYSAYRNRNQFPEIAQFDVMLSQTGSKSIDDALDLVIDSYPVYEFVTNSITILGQVFSGGDRTNPILNNTASDLNGYYNGYNLVDNTTAEVREIIGYTGSSHTVTLSSPFNNTWTSADIYDIVDGSTSSIISIQPVNRFGSDVPSTIDNFYNDYLLYDELHNESRNITGYDATLRVVTVSPPFTYTPAGNQVFSIRKALPSVLNNTFGGGSINQTTIDLGASALPIDNFYKGSYLFPRLSGGTVPPTYAPVPLPPYVYKIQNYDGATKLATIYPPLPFPLSELTLAGTTYDILIGSRDNFAPMVYTGSTLSQSEQVCYEIQLVSFILPNVPLDTGSRIAFYPYVYVEFSNLTAPGGLQRNVIYSNNPYASRAMFIVPVTDLVAPADSPFVRFGSCAMTQTIKFKPNDNIRFSVFLPDGRLLRPIKPDNMSPLPPNFSLQLNAVFSIKRI